MEEVFCKKVEEKHAKIEKGERWRHKNRKKEITSKKLIFRDAVQRMRKEQEALEEERQELAQRREEYQRELQEWEEGLETVSFVWYKYKIRKQIREYTNTKESLRSGRKGWKR